MAVIIILIDFLITKCLKVKFTMNYFKEIVKFKQFIIQNIKVIVLTIIINFIIIIII